MEHEVKHANRSKTWLPSPLPYEPYCTNAEVMVMQKDTVILCPMQHAAGWTFEHIDVERGETIESNKQGQEMYIIFGLSSNVATFATSITSKILSFNSSSNNQTIFIPNQN